jgi:hypothetical protein
MQPRQKITAIADDMRATNAEDTFPYQLCNARNFMQKHVLALAAAATLLSACGGGGTDAASMVAPGETFSTDLTVGGRLVEQTQYRIYGTSKSGELVTTKDNLASDAFIPIKIAQTRFEDGQVTKAAAAVVSEETLRSFFPQLWQALAQHYGISDPALIANEVHDLDIPLDSIYLDYQASGLNLAGFIDFYEALDEFPALASIEMTESDLSSLLESSNTSPAQLLSALVTQQRSWRDFLRTMVARGDDFSRLHDLHQRSGLTLTDFALRYVQQPQNASTKAVPAGVAVAKFVWDVIKDNRPTTVNDGAFSRVLSTRDDDWEKYARAKEGSSEVVELKVKGRIPLFTLYETRFALTGYYDARHSGFAGHWMPLVNMDVLEMYAIFGWKLNAKAKLTQPVNIGTEEAPIPEMPVTMEINQSGVVRNMTNKYTFKANGQKGFTYVPR